MKNQTPTIPDKTSTTDYYVTKDKIGFLELRQTRFKALHDSGQNHPWDICAIARDEAELRSMVESCKLGTVDYSGAAIQSATL